MSQTNVQPLGLRLFLEGVEVPVISAQVDISPDQPALASIQIVPSDTALSLLPRTLVHLFYLDTSDGPLVTKAKDQTQGQTTPRSGNPSAENNDNRFDALDTQYKILFTGEVIGLNYGKSAISRQLILQCMDLSSYWDACYQWFADYSVGGGGLTDKSHTFVGAGQGLFDSIAGGHQWVLGRLINSKPKNPAYQRTKGLLAGILHMFEAIGGIRYSRNNEGFRGVNDFFTIAELRYNLIGMIGAVEKDETSAKMFANKAFKSWLRNGMTSLGNLLSFRDIIMHVNRHIFHNIYPNPVAYFVPNREETVTRTGTAESSIYSDSKSLGPRIRSGVRQLKTNLDTAVNLFVEAEGAAQEANELTSSTARNVSRQAYQAALGIVEDAKQEVGTVREFTRQLNTDDSSSVQQKISRVESRIDEALDILGRVSEGSIRNVEAKSREVRIGLEQALNILQDLLGPGHRTSRKFRKQIKLTEGAHLYNQLIFPETFFVAPPTCNVIFPDQVSQFNFSRNFLREVTRLSARGGMGLLTGGNKRSAQLLGRHYYAPNIKNLRGEPLFLTAEKGSTVIMPHEIHSGIVPKMEWVTDGHRWGVKAAKETGVEDAFYKNAKVAYVQRLANFQFYLHRWSARSMTMSGVFMPHLVMGLPAVIFDRPTYPPDVLIEFSNRMGRQWNPTQYLGKIVTLSHQVNQGGGLTQASFAYARTHRGVDDEFLGLLSREVQGTKRKELTFKFNPRELINSSRARVRSNRRALIRVIRRYVNGEAVDGLQFSRDIVVKNQTVKESPTVSLSFVEATELGLGDVTTSEGLVLPSLFTLTLERSVAVGKSQVVNIAVEEALRPGWYSDVWGNERIGTDVYRPLLGIGAIVDDIAISQDTQNEFLQRLSATVPKKDQQGNTVQQEVVQDDSFPAELGSREIISGSIEEAIDSIGLLYAVLRHEGGDVHEFIRQYTSRPVADIEDILGSEGLRFDDQGNVDPTLPDNVVEGFHSRAFGDYNVEVKLPDNEGVEIQAGEGAMAALFPGSSEVNPPRKSVLTRGGVAARVRPELDPRGRARARVKAYIQELEVSRGLLG